MPIRAASSGCSIYRSKNRPIERDRDGRRRYSEPDTREPGRSRRRRTGAGIAATSTDSDADDRDSRRDQRRPAVTHHAPRPLRSCWPGAGGAR